MKLLLLMAVTADGKIARHSAHFPNWTGKADKRMFKKTTEAAGVVIMGSRTYEAIGKPLPNRLNVVLTRRPQKYQSEAGLVFSSDPPRILLSWLASKGYETAVLAGGATINSLFLNQQLIDEMVLTVVPRIFGQGMSLFAETADARLALIEAKVLEADIQVLHYRLLYDQT